MSAEEFLFIMRFPVSKDIFVQRDQLIQRSE